MKEQDWVLPLGAIEQSHPPTLSITEVAQVRAKIRTEAQLHPFIPGSQLSITVEAYGFNSSCEQTKAIK